MTYLKPRPTLASRQVDILKCCAPLGIRKTRAEITAAMGCCADSVANELRFLSEAGLLRTVRPAEGMLQYELTAKGEELVRA